MEKTRRMTRKDFLEVWKPIITVRCISNDPYVYQAHGVMDYYGQRKEVFAIGETPRHARQEAMRKLEDKIGIS